jgi:hypothetical protein
MREAALNPADNSIRQRLPFSWRTTTKEGVFMEFFETLFKRIILPTLFLAVIALFAAQPANAQSESTLTYIGTSLMNGTPCDWGSNYFGIPVGTSGASWSTPATSYSNGSITYTFTWDGTDAVPSAVYFLITSSAETSLTCTVNFSGASGINGSVSNYVVDDGYGDADVDKSQYINQEYGPLDYRYDYLSSGKHLVRITPSSNTVTVTTPNKMNASITGVNGGTETTCTMTLAPDNRYLTIGFNQTYHKGIDPNTQAAIQVADAPDSNGVEQMTTAVEYTPGGANGDDTWSDAIDSASLTFSANYIGGWADVNDIDSYKWSDSQSGYSASGNFGPDEIGDFSPSYLWSADTTTFPLTSHVHLTATDGVDGAVGDAYANVTFHKSVENIVETNEIDHPIKPTNANATMHDFYAADPVAASLWQQFGDELDCHGSAVPSQAAGTSVTVSYSLSLSSDITIGEEPLEAQYGVTGGASYAYTYSATTTITGEPYADIQWMVAPKWVEHQGNQDCYTAQGFAGVHPYDIKFPVSAGDSADGSVISYATLATYPH